MRLKVKQHIDMRQTISVSLKKSQSLIIGGVILLLVCLAVFLSNWPGAAGVWPTFTTVFLGIFIEALPFLFLGTLASGLVEVFVDQDAIHRFTPRSPVLSAIAGSLLGLIFPVCECGVVPLVRRLFRKGFPIPAGIAFLLAAPIINPIVILSTATAFGFGKVLFMRVGFAILIAVITGLVFSVTSSQWDTLRPTPWITSETAEIHDHCCHDHGEHETHPTTAQKIRQVFQISLDEFFEIGRYLIAGSMISAGLQAFVPQSILLGIGEGPVTSVLVMMGLAILLSICSTVDAFVALGFVGAFSTASILSFLLYGPMVDIKSILMFTRVFKPRTVLYMITIPFVLVLLIGSALNYFTAI
jgi:uncharacterized membrane protein YraQ (UPF0718 family)